MRQIAASLLLATAILSPAAGPTLASEAPLEASYAVRWGGIEIGRFSTELRRTGERYHLAYQARTSGPLRWVVGLASDGWAAGQLTDGAVMAEHFRGRSSWRDGEGHWRVSFATDGSATEIELDAATLSDREPVPEPLRRGPDPLSLMLGAMQAVSAGEILEGESFDGRRAMRYSLACQAEKSPIRPVALGAMTRDALVCAADGELVAGRSKRWSERAGREPRARDSARVWLVPEVGGMAYWPVRIEAESRWGRVTIELDTFTDPAA